MTIKILDKKEKEKILDKIKKFGIKKLPYKLIKYKDKIYAFSGNLNKNEINKINRLNIKQLGAEILSKEGKEYRLTLDSLNLLNPNKRIIEIPDKEAKKWLEGREARVNTKIKEGFVILKNRGDLIGCGKLTNKSKKTNKTIKKVTNFIPKGRRTNN